MTHTVFVIDDDEIVRDATSLLVKSMGFPTQDFSCATDFLDKYDPSRTGCIVTDVRMPNISGIDLQRILKERGIVLPIIFISGHGDIPLAVEAMRNGALDFLQKPYNDQDLLDNINKALVICDELKIKNQQALELSAKLATLTNREAEIMRHVVSGESNKQIANTLNLSERTIELHRSRVMHKMACKSLAALVKLATHIPD